MSILPNANIAFAEAIVEVKPPPLPIAPRATHRKAARPIACDRLRAMNNLQLGCRAEGRGRRSHDRDFGPGAFLAELASSPFANLLDYMRVGPDGDPVLDFSK